EPGGELGRFRRASDRGARGRTAPESSRSAAAPSGIASPRATLAPCLAPWDDVSLERKVLYDVDPFRGFGSLGDELQVLHVRTHRDAKLIAEQEARKRAALSLPVLGHRLEAEILREEQATEDATTLKQLVVEQLGSVIILRSQHIDAAQAQLVVD